MPYIPLTEEQKKEMLEKIGVKSFEDLISFIPKDLLFNKDLNLPSPISEYEVRKLMYELSKKNYNLDDYVSFMGAGIYDHYIPAIVDFVISRSEFYTAYTPYQAEVSQGTLQTIFEYQSMICELTGMEISNASMYDGASASAEAIIMAYHNAKKVKNPKAIISGTINPLYKEVIKTYVQGLGIELIFLNEDDYKINIDELKSKIDENVIGVLVQTPNFFGNIEEMNEISEIVHQQKNTLLITCVDPLSLALFKAPSEYNADIAIGEGQILGNSQYFGGPLLGFMATKKSLARSMPGRIVALSEDNQGRRALTLSLQTREQHIKREKATSNICSNEALCALAATVYLSAVGKHGFIKVAKDSYENAHLAYSKIKNLGKFKTSVTGMFFREFAIELPVKASLVIERGLEEKIFAGVDLGRFNEKWKNKLLVAFTEKRTEAEIDALVSLLKKVCD